MSMLQVKHKLCVTYNRLHHRALDTTQLSPLNQEKMTVRFHQALVHVEALTIGLAIAVNTDCI